MSLTPTSRFAGLYKAAQVPEGVPYADDNAWRQSDFRNPLAATGTGALLGGGVGLLIAALMRGGHNVNSAGGLADIILSKDKGSVLMPTAIGALAGAALGGVGSARLNQQVANSYENESRKFAMIKEAAIPWGAIKGVGSTAGHLGMGALLALSPLGLRDSVPGMVDAWKNRDWMRFGGEALSSLGNLAMFVPGLGQVAGGAVKGLGLLSKLWRAKKMVGAGGSALKTVGTGRVFNALASGGAKATMPEIAAGLKAVPFSSSPYAGTIRGINSVKAPIYSWGRNHPWLSGGMGESNFGKSVLYGAPSFAAYGGGALLNAKADQRDGIAPPPRETNRPMGFHEDGNPAVKSMRDITAPAPTFGLTPGTEDRPVYSPLHMYNNLSG